MNLLFSCIGRRGYVADYFRQHLRTGDRIIGTSHTDWTVGFRACDAGVVLPPIASGEYVAAVLDTCRRLEIDALLSFFDADVATLSGHLSAFEQQGVTAFLPGPDLVAMAHDKWGTFTGLSRSGFQVPDCYASVDAALDGIETGQAKFPLVVKPRFGFGSANTLVARDELQLRAFFAYAPDMLIQQFVDGNEFNLSVLGDLQANPLSVVPCRKLLMAGGETQHAVTIEHPDLLDVGYQLAAKLRLVGPLDVDLIESSDGRLFVLDLNPRFGGAYPVAHLAGADFPALIVDMARGGRPSPRIGAYQRGICMLKDIAPIGGPIAEFLPGLAGGNTA